MNKIYDLERKKKILGGDDRERKHVSKK